MPAPSIAFLADDPPIREDVSGWGLTRVNARLVAALGDSIGVVTCGSAGIYSKEDLSTEVRVKTTMWGEQTLVQRLRKRYLHTAYDAELAFALALIATTRAIKGVGATHLFCPCGVNPRTLGHAIAVKNSTGLPLTVYLVDDFLDGAVLSGNTEALRIAIDDVPRWIQQVDRIFVISAGLGERIETLYGVQSTVLQLPYRQDLPSPESLNGPIKDQLIFVGNMSHFYLPGLREAVGLVSEMQREGIPLTLRFTLPNEADVQRLLGTNKGIECRSCATPEELQKEVATSIAAFAPYSFDDAHAVMVRTSFPSKMLDYLASARSILTYGPDYSTAFRFFQENGLQSTITTRSGHALRGAVEDSRAQRGTHGESYRRVLMENHSPHMVAAQILASLE